MGVNMNGLFGRLEPQRVILSRPARSLMLAAEAGAIDRARRLIARGANVQARDADGWTALMLAAKKGHTEIARLLLEEGADPDARDRFGVTALDCARRSGRPELVALLRSKGSVR